jgi:DNA sulfur modification protein DndD
MRIDKIYLKNYRQFRELEIDLSEKKGYDLHIIVGTNGTGKTNILNSINWCLYNEEPHLSKDSARLPIPNIKTIEEIEDGETFPVEVEVRAEIDPDNNIRFIRKAVFRKADKKSVTQQSSEFEVVFTDERDNTIIAQDDEAIDWVERTVPSGIREFFFFDGERLDKYFREATGQKIRHAVFQISQINLLKNELERKIEIMRRDLTNMASRANPNIEEKLKELEKTKK